MTKVELLNHLIGLLSLVVAVLPWFFDPKILVARWWRNRALAKEKRELLRVRRQIALLRRTRSPFYSTTRMARAVVVGLCYLGLLIALMSVAAIDPSVSQEFVGLVGYIGGLGLYVTVVVLSSRSTAAKYQKKMLVLLKKRRELLEKRTSNAKTY
ncbi:MAG: hypothetical protein ACT4NV_09080 [Rhodoferax sp.]